MTLAEAIHNAALRLTEAGVPDARFDAEVLLRHTVGRDRAWLLAHLREALEEPQRRMFEVLVGRRERREPLQYITGAQEFRALEFVVTPDVLIPRPETELVVEAAVSELADREAASIIDLCTGSGCIAVSLAAELPSSRLSATDLSAKALAVAGENARRHGVADRIRFLEGDLFGPLEGFLIDGTVDVVTANPPYVRTGERTALQPEVRDFEPSGALFAGEDGTEVIQRIIAAAPRYLRQKGVLVMEMGMGQAETVRSLAEGAKAYESIEILKDLAGIERVVLARKGGF